MDRQIDEKIANFYKLCKILLDLSDRFFGSFCKLITFYTFGDIFKSIGHTKKNCYIDLKVAKVCNQ